ncbi:MAG: hypothetical protein Q8O19_06185 [Rectinemataceae bacterium]|nr:hypothetical protein [Rectinemataceae bacterium]
MQARIICFQRRPVSEQQRLKALLAKIPGIVPHLADSPGGVREDSIVCTLHLEPGEAAPSRDLQEHLTIEVTNILRDWAGKNVHTVLVRYTDKPAPRETQAILAY